MNSLPSFASPHKQGILIRLRIQPRSSSDSAGPIIQGEWKIRLKAPPVDGQANTSLKKILSRLFHTPASGIIVLKGQSGRSKSVLIPVTKLEFLNIWNPKMLSGSLKKK